MKRTSIPVGRWVAASLCLFTVGVVHAYEGFDPSLDPTQVTAASGTADKSRPQAGAHTSARVEHASIAMKASAQDKHHRLRFASAHSLAGGAH